MGNNEIIFTIHEPEDTYALCSQIIRIYLQLHQEMLYQRMEELLNSSPNALKHPL